MLIFERFLDQELGYICYIVGCKQTGQVAAVDVGLNAAPFSELVSREQWVITHVLDTHASSNYLLGGYLLAASIGASYVSPFASKMSPIKACFEVAKSGMHFYVGYVKVDVSIKERIANYTFTIKDPSKGGFSRSLTKGGEKLPIRTFKKEASKKAHCLVNNTPIGTYQSRIKKLNESFQLPPPIEAKRLTTKSFYSYYQRGRQIIDLRSVADFEEKFIPGSLFVGQSYITRWAPYLIDSSKPLILVGEGYGSLQKSIMELARLAVFHVEGVLDATLESWKHAGYPLTQLQALEGKDFFSKQFDVLIDVRTENEVRHQKHEGAINIPLDQLYEHKALFIGKVCGFFCSGGVRSLRAASIAMSFGAKTCTHLKGGGIAYLNKMAVINFSIST